MAAEEVKNERRRPKKSRSINSAGRHLGRRSTPPAQPPPSVTPENRRRSGGDESSSVDSSESVDDHPAPRYRSPPGTQLLGSRSAPRQPLKYSLELSKTLLPVGCTAPRGHRFRATGS
ncbi:hypothetical protein Q1695_013093 [Nippostrongylus brasiliensis]|nr:hypothetical protein Q1695_013093 [Nippostrongylus brasiliensis]